MLLEEKIFPMVHMYNITQWDTHEVNYWGITKCGNTAVKGALLGKNVNRRPLQKTGLMVANGAKLYIEASKNVHESINSKYITREDAMANGYTNFTVIRNPIDRFKSFLSDFNRRDPSYYGFDQKHTIDEFLTHLENTTDVERDTHLKSQVCHIFQDTKQLVENIFVLERINKLEDFLSVRINKLNSTDSDIDLNEAHIQRLKCIYHDDFSLYASVLEYP